MQFIQSQLLGQNISKIIQLMTGDLNLGLGREQEGLRYKSQGSLEKVYSKTTLLSYPQII
jgi:hypothetical protein